LSPPGPVVVSGGGIRAKRGGKQIYHKMKK